MTNQQHCTFCLYEWLSRVSTPKACPRCKRRFDYEQARYKIVDFRLLLKEAGI